MIVLPHQPTSLKEEILDLDEARSYLNHLLTLNIRKEEAFGPLALNFLKENDLEKIGLQAEERFNLIMATIQAIVQEPKRYKMKLDLLKQARDLLGETRFSNPRLVRQLEQDIKKTEAELDIYNQAMKPEPLNQGLEKQTLIIQSDAPDYFLNLAQKRATEYYQNKFALTKEAKTAQSFSGNPRKFAPDDKNIHKEFSGACGPFMNSRINAFHLMLPFDIKISKKPDDPLDAVMRVFYTKMGYSFPLAYENGKLCSYHDGEALDLEIDDPHLLFVSASRVKEREFRFDGEPAQPGLPPEMIYPVTVLE